MVVQPTVHPCRIAVKGIAPRPLMHPKAALGDALSVSDAASGSTAGASAASIGRLERPIRNLLRRVGNGVDL
jgi:hypothetical protein